MTQQHIQPVDLTNNMNMTNREIAAQHFRNAADAVDNNNDLSATNQSILGQCALHGEKDNYELVLVGYNEDNYLAEWEN